MLRQTVALRGHYLGETHPDTIISRTNLENVIERHSIQGDPRKAENRQQQWPELNSKAESLFLAK